jgi:KDO2-lipid IV(A) lauroyltransferase
VAVSGIAATLGAPAAAQPDGAAAGGVRRAAAEFWLRAFFWAAEHAPAMLRRGRHALCRGAFRSSPSVRRGTTANARRILGAGAAEADVEALALRTLENFFGVCCDIGRGFAASREQLLARVASIEGRENYDAARSARRGVIVVTAHVGSFEVGMAALREQERGRIHVVFRRDPIARFERQRSDLRRRLGVEEAPVDEGWTVWMRLRDALLADEAVVLQGDRVMPGQKGEPVPFLGGHLLLPTGPVRLALATGAPIVPILSIRQDDGGVRLFIESPIEAKPAPHGDAGSLHPALLHWAAVLERFVRAFPDQWLILQPALLEDARDGAA